MFECVYRHLCYDCTWFISIFILFHISFGDIFIHFDGIRSWKIPKNIYYIGIDVDFQSNRFSRCIGGIQNIYIWSLLYFVIVCKMCPDQTVTYCTDLWNIYGLRNRCDTLASGSVINYYFLGTEKTRQKIHSKYVGVLSRAFV